MWNHPASGQEAEVRVERKVESCGSYQPEMNSRVLMHFSPCFLLHEYTRYVIEILRLASVASCFVISDLSEACSLVI